MGCSASLDFATSGGTHLSFYWTMDEAGDANKLDSTVLQSWDTVATTSSPPGLFSNGVELDCGPAGHGCNSGNNAAFAFNDVTSKGLSAWFWIKLVTPPTPGDSTFIQFFIECQDSVLPNDSELLLVMTFNPATVPAYTAFVRHSDFLGGNTASTTSITFNPGIAVWHMVAVTLDLVAQTLNLYIDGALAATVADTYLFRTSDQGHMVLAGAIPFVHPMVAVADEFGLSLSGALSAAQITGLFNGGVGMTWPQVNTIVPYP